MVQGLVQVGVSVWLSYSIQMRAFVLFLALSIFSLPCPAQTRLPESQIARAVQAVLRETGVPAASIAVSHEKAGYTKASGTPRLNPPTPATPEMRFKIASNSK